MGQKTWNGIDTVVTYRLTFLHRFALPIPAFAGILFESKLTEYVKVVHPRKSLRVVKTLTTTYNSPTMIDISDQVVWGSVGYIIKMIRKIMFIYTLAVTVLPVSAADYAVQMITDSKAYTASRPEEMPGMDHMAMRGIYGSYPMTREASGTAWMPDSSPMEGFHGKSGAWETMAHGYANVVYDRQGGKRGDSKIFSESMAMLMASRPLGAGTFGLRGMFSLDPAMGKNGYPLLLQTGETANGVEPLIDRQHPHDLFMELAALYSVPAGEDGSVFGYFGYPGEPALGPATFMHRFSGADNPEAPISHHWLDSTHISYGVITAGLIRKNWKLDASAFNGREPDQFRWNFDTLRLNSYSARLTWNPGDDWSLQVSRGIIKSPEALSSEVDQKRTTASVSYNRPKGRDNWQTTIAWGQDDNDPGHATTALLLESAFTLRAVHTVFGRVEYVGKDELFQSLSPQAGRVFYVGKLSVGYIYDIAVSELLKLGFGGLGSVYALPGTVESAYGHNPMSGMLFARMKL